MSTAKSHKGRRIDDGSHQVVQVRVEHRLYLWYRTVAILRGTTMQALMERALQDFQERG